jgi:hypothetical protein
MSIHEERSFNRCRSRTSSQSRLPCVDISSARPEIVESQQRLTILDQGLDLTLVFDVQIAVNAASKISAASRISAILTLSESKKSWRQRCVNPLSTTRDSLRKILVSEPAKVPWLRKLDDVSVHDGVSSATTIRHLPPSCRHQLPRTARRWFLQSRSRRQQAYWGASSS